MAATWIQRASFGLPLLLVGLVCAPASMAGEFYERDGTAIRGYDPVAYFTERKPVKGSARYASVYKGARFHFANPAHRDAFDADPARFAPQYGGFCAFAVSKGYKAKIEPDAWTIVGDRLFLNYDRSVRELWMEDVPGHVRKADRNWPSVKVLTKVVQ